jgi:HSP20 family protein
MGTLRPFNLFDAGFPDVFRGVMPPAWSDADAFPPAIRIDVEETETGYRVKADMPGLAKDDIRIDVDGNVVSIATEVRREKVEEKDGKVLRRERHVGTMSRAFTLPVEVDADRAEASYADGVLVLKLPRKAGATAHRLPVA